MSWSSRRRRPIRRCALLAAAICLLGAAPVFAAQYYIQPSASVGAENDSNLDLDPGPGQEVQGYLANAGALVGINTPNSDSLIRGRLDYRDYPKDSGDDRLEEYLDFRSDYNTQLSHAGISGLIDHRDEFNSQLNSALYDDINPVLPTNPTTGRTVTGQTQTNVLVMPTFTQKFSPLIALGVSGVYQRVDLTPTVLGLADFNYYQGKGTADYSFSQRSDLSFGVFGSKFNADQAGSSATGEGVAFEWDTKWSPLLSSAASVTYQRTDTTYRTNIAVPSSQVLQTDVNTWGANLSVVYQSQLNQYRLTAQRIVTPSAAGGMYVNNQAQLQYTRNLTQRLTFTGATIFLKNTELPANLSLDNRSYLQSLVDLKWMIKPTWYIQGGYQYSWQKYEQNPDGASNNRIYIRFGYQGLSPQR
jgi:hypothetical protein